MIHIADTESVQESTHAQIIRQYIVEGEGRGRGKEREEGGEERGKKEGRGREERGRGKREGGEKKGRGYTSSWHTWIVGDVRRPQAKNSRKITIVACITLGLP